ncbi:MAG: glycoside hydrolase family 3 protein, partial [Nocardiopsaceae bacterium]|nr:glycoside hydrolase family 3 protein [Nocardiopsaceae bacterium]
ARHVSGAAARGLKPAPSAGRGAASSCVDRTFARLTEAQRVGQLFLVGMASDSAGPTTAAAERRYHFGSVLFASDTSEGVKAVAGTTSYVQSLATPADTGGVRFFVAANQEGGEVQNLKGPGFSDMPSALDQGSWPASYLRRQAAAWGHQLRSAGVNLDLAPVMDVVPAATAASNAPIGEVDREFGHAPAVNGAHGAAFIAGMAAAGVATSAKHFPGLGQVTGNTDYTSRVVDSVTTPRDPDLAVYRSATRAGAAFMMVALATYTKIDPSRLAVFSPVVIRLLRSSTGFRGVVMSDDLGDAAAVASVPAGQRAISFLNAGGDMITSQSFGPAEEMAAAVLSRASSDPSLRAKVNAAVKSVLAAKQAYGLLGCE